MLRSLVGSEMCIRDSINAEYGSLLSGKWLDRVSMAGRPVKLVDSSMLQAHFHMPLAQAAKKMGISPTLLKQVCRKYGIDRWPHRKLKSFGNKLSNIRTQLEQPPELDKAVARGEGASEVSFDQLQRQFHRPLNEAAQRLGVCATILKRLARKHGISKWPYRKLKSLHGQLTSLESRVHVTRYAGTKTEELQLELADLHRGFETAPAGPRKENTMLPGTGEMAMSGNGFEEILMELEQHPIMEELGMSREGWSLTLDRCYDDLTDMQ
eukprot:TRINITY_DN29379_c0_g1_i1.p1 TRINITY_DN29379_c0_g1~~TRINITY_DN29379_c0_g1_i1.p1  ORF type:complete len:267 (+),score=64.84 TRINITY_DN29379_c0_g1_i1:94-894(+)